MATTRDGVKVAVVGGGAFGTAMATMAARAGHDVNIYVRDQNQADSINTLRKNPKYLSDFELHPSISASTDLISVLNGALLVILSIPAQTVPTWLEEHKDQIDPQVLLLNTAKGLYLKEKRLLSEAVNDALGRQQPYALLSGPSFAKEMMQDMPTAVVVASRFLYNAVAVQRMLSTERFRIYASQDMIGVELGGALKNPLAIGAGMLEGMSMGINTISAYVTRSSMELMELCKAMGGEPQTISGLSGIGDLMLTAFGEMSRNRTFGKKLAQGEKLVDLLKTTTVEGVPTAQVAVYFADKCGLDLPIFRSVASIIEGEELLENVHLDLLGRVAEGLEVNLSTMDSPYYRPTPLAYSRLRGLSTDYTSA